MPEIRDFRSFIYELLDEAIVRVVFDFFENIRGKKKEPPASTTPSAMHAALDTVQPVQVQEMAYLIRGGPGLTESTRINFTTVHAEVVQARGARAGDRLYRALALGKKQLCDGIWPKAVERRLSRKERQKAQQQQQAHETGWEADRVWVQAMNHAGKSPREVQKFFEELLEEKLWNVDGTVIKEEVKEVARKAFSFVVIFALTYLLILTGLGVLALLTMASAIRHPQQTSTLVWAFAWFLIFTTLLWPVAKPLLPQGE